MKSLKETILLIMMLTTACVVACSRSQTERTHPEIPTSWIDNSNAQNTTLEEPSEKIASAVRLNFQTHANALERITSQQPLVPQSRTPWHLDGMIGSFAVDVSGVFGALVSDGAPGVKVTWQQQHSDSSAPKKVKPQKVSSFKFNSRMTEKDVVRMLEPAVQMAVGTKSVRNIPVFRNTLRTEGLKFLSTVRALSTIHSDSDWHVAGYQLGLFINASGLSVLPANSGVGFSLIFDWDKTASADDSSAPQLNEYEQVLQKNLASFVSTMTTIIPNARAEAGEIRRAGFDLEVFQVGLGVAAGGDIGIASAQASVVGRVIFKKAAVVSAMISSAVISEAPIASDELNIIGPSAPDFSFAQGTASLFSENTDGANVYRVSTERFRKGIRRAIGMATFFARNAMASDTRNWKVTEIEASFDAAVSGDVHLVTVGGIGLIRLGFERIDL